MCTPSNMFTSVHLTLVLHNLAHTDEADYAKMKLPSPIFVEEVPYNNDGLPFLAPDYTNYIL